MEVAVWLAAQGGGAAFSARSLDVTAFWNHGCLRSVSTKEKRRLSPPWGGSLFFCWDVLLPLFILSTWVVSLGQLLGFFIGVGINILGGFGWGLGA
jgi:hypothetical protein